jgi:hypothetical protein
MCCLFDLPPSAIFDLPTALVCATTFRGRSYIVNQHGKSSSSAVAAALAIRQHTTPTSHTVISASRTTVFSTFHTVIPDARDAASAETFSTASSPASLTG